MEFLMQYHLTGLTIGAATFLIIGLFHPLVIKGEYYFGVRCWWVFALMGLAAVAGSLWAGNILYPAGRVGRIVVLVYRRALRAAQAGGEGLVSEAKPPVNGIRFPLPSHMPGGSR